MRQFWVAPTHEDSTEFENFFFQRKNKSSGSKSVCSFSIILTLKGFMTF